MKKFTISKAPEEAIVFKNTQVVEETVETPEEALLPNNKEISIFNKRDVEYKRKKLSMTHLHIQ